MRQPLFVDTGFVLALELARDENHARAQAQWQAWSRHPSKLVTTTYVFDEIVTYFNSRSLHAKALQVGQLLLTSPSVELVSVDEDLFFRGWEYFRRHQDKRYSLTDCLSFVVMKDRKLTTALAFDHHFEQAGFRFFQTVA